jgi:hypothetical protein
VATSEHEKLFIPEGEIPRLKRLTAMSIEDITKLGRALAKQEFTLDFEMLVKSTAASSGLNLEIVADAISVLWRSLMVQRRLGFAPREFLELVGVNLRERYREKWSEEDARHWSERLDCLSALVSPDGAIAIGSKAAELLLEQQLVFCRARTLTDVRPVFDQEAKSLQGFVPFHTLAVEYYESGKPCEIHIALDLNDISELRGQLERAEQKEILLRGKFKELGLLVIQTGGKRDA